jgi:acetyl esterase/lipase
MPRKLARTFLALPILLLLGACSRLEFAAVNLGVDQSAVHSANFDPEHGLSLDIHRARGVSGTAPVVVFLYGGDWRNGRRQDYRFVGQSLSEAGLLVFVPDYRKFPQVTFPAFVEDAARSVAWVRRHAADYGGDPSRIFLVGHSAGAHIVAMLATDSRFLQAVGMRPRDLAGVVGLSGPYDFLPLTDPDLQEVFAPQSGWALSQPVNFVDGDEPPFLLFQGTADTTVRPHNSVSLAAKLRSVGEPVELQMMDGTGHAGTLLDLVRSRNGVRAQTLQFIGGRGAIAATAINP